MTFECYRPGGGGVGCGKMEGCGGGSKRNGGEERVFLEDSASGFGGGG